MTKVGKQAATDEEKHVQTQIEAEQEIEVVVEPPSSPVETAQASQAKRGKFLDFDMTFLSWD